MADAILGQSRIVGKPTSFAFNTTSAFSALQASANLAEPTLVDGVVRHDYVDPDVQVTILAVLDETGSATLGDIVEALPGHPKPAGAVWALVGARVLRIEEGVVNAHSRLSRALPTDRGDGGDGNTPDDAPQPPGNGKPAGADGTSLVAIDPGALREITVSTPYAPAIFCVSGADRGTLRLEHLLNNPGIYIAFWGRKIYVGASMKVVDRLTRGQHPTPLGQADRIIAIVDRTGQLDWDGAQVAERLGYRQLTASGELIGRNDEPSGGQVEEAQYKLVHDFVEASLAALYREGLLSPAVPKSKEGREVPTLQQSLFATRAVRSCGQPSLYRLDACGVEAQARVDDNGWTLLAGSAVRGSVMPSAYPSARQRRLELLHSGALVRNGEDYLLTRDLPFGSASGAAHFVLGSKTRADIWEEVDTSHTRPLQH